MTIWTVCINKCTFFIAILILVNPLCIHPFIERATMIKYTIEDNAHSFFMHFFYKMYKEFVTCLKITLICNTRNIFARIHVIIFPVR